jgi:hypothetical protein
MPARGARRRARDPRDRWPTWMLDESSGLYPNVSEAEAAAKTQIDWLGA